jgi:ribokinase
MDLVIRAPVLPTAGETVVGSDLVQTPGGKGANQSVAAARLGAPVAFVGNVGDDAFGAALRGALVTAGVDTSWLRVNKERPSGVALIVVDALGENLIAVAPGANGALSVEQVETALGDLGASDLVLAQLEVPLDAVGAAARLARRRGARLVLNVAPAQPVPAALLESAWGLVLNASEAALFSGVADPTMAVTALRRRGPELVIVTLGGDGLLLATPDGLTDIAAYPVDVVDTTAAGDAFCGAFAAALLDGQAPDSAARFAAMAGALATTKLGAQASLPRRADVEARLTRPGQPESRT